jgi:hypothetical protein
MRPLLFEGVERADFTGIEHAAAEHGIDSCPTQESRR